VSGEYVIAKADASPVLNFPTGIALITIYACRRYLAADAVVRQRLRAVRARRAEGD
jgi:hypothetical protein